MKTIMDVLSRNEVTRKGKRGVPQIFNKEMRRVIFMQRFFDQEGGFPSYRDIAKQYYLGKKKRNDDMVDHYVSHECVRQTLSHQFDTILNTPENIAIIDKIADVINQSDALSINDLVQSLNCVFPNVSWPQNPQAIVELINSMIETLYPDEGPRLATFMLPARQYVIIRKTPDINDVICNLNRFITSLDKKMSKKGVMSRDEITKLARKKGVTSDVVVDVCLQHLDSIVKKEVENIWFAKDPSQSKIFHKMNLIASFYFHRHGKLISFEHLFSQLIRTFEFRSAEREQVRFMLKLANMYDSSANVVKQLLSYQDVMDGLSTTEQKVVSKLKAKNIETFRFTTLKTIFDESEISFNSLRVYMTYSPIFKQAFDTESDPENNTMRLSLI